MTMRKLMPARCFSFHDTRLYDRFERVPVPSNKFVLLPFGGLLPFVYIFDKDEVDDDDNNDDDDDALCYESATFTCAMSTGVAIVRIILLSAQWWWTGKVCCVQSISFAYFLCAHSTPEMDFAVGLCWNNNNKMVESTSHLIIVFRMKCL